MIHKNVSILNLASCFESLYSGGYDSSFVSINLLEDDKFLQFMKYVKPDGESGLQLDFPFAEWSKEYYQGAQEILDSNNINYSIEKISRNGVNEFIVVDIGSDAKLANKVAKLILINVFNLDEKSKVSVEYGNV